MARAALHPGIPYLLLDLYYSTREDLDQQEALSGEKAKDHMPFFPVFQQSKKWEASQKESSVERDEPALLPGRTLLFI